jgi:hypothetical protein
MNDERFFDLAMKAIAQQANDAERKDLDAMLADKPELRAELLRLEKDALVAEDALPLVAACTESTGQFPAYARERLQTTVRQTLGGPESVAKEPHRSLAWGWRWGLGLAGATTVVLLVAVPVFHPPNKLEPVQGLAVKQEATPNEPAPPGTQGGRSSSSVTLGSGSTAGMTVSTGLKGQLTASNGLGPLTEETFKQAAAQNGLGPLTEEAFKQAAAQNLPVIQLAIFDLGGGARRADKNEVTTLEEAWKGIPIQNFSKVSELQAWRWPNDAGRPAARIVYASGVREVWLSGSFQGSVFQKTFPLDKDLATTLQQAKAFIEEQTER